MGFWRGVGRSVNPYTGVKTFFEGMDELTTAVEQMEQENARLDAEADRRARKDAENEALVQAQFGMSVDELLKQEYQKMFGGK
jgi:hypothetical protein